MRKVRIVPRPREGFEMKGTFDVTLPGPGHSRIGRLVVRGLELATPAYIPAFSSARDEELTARLLATLVPNYPLKSFLVSAVDLDRAVDAASKPQLMDKLNAFASNHVMFLDSGSYELGRDSGTVWGTPEVLRVALQTRAHVLVAFDPAPSPGQYLEVGVRLRDEIDAAKEAFEKVPHLHDDALTTFVIRSNRVTDPAGQADEIADIVTQNEGWVDILAFPDVDLGPDIIVRCRFAAALRSSLDSVGLDTPIHVLGCSEPLSMVMYSLAGADLFDGNGWWDRTINAARMSYQDLSYLRLLECRCASCRSVDFEKAGPEDYGSAVMNHNLLQYDTLMGDVRAAIIHHSFGTLFKRTPIGAEAQRLLNNVLETE